MEKVCHIKKWCLFWDGNTKKKREENNSVTFDWIRETIPLLWNPTERWTQRGRNLKPYIHETWGLHWRAAWEGLNIMGVKKKANVFAFLQGRMLPFSKHLVETMIHTIIIIKKKLQTLYLKINIYRTQRNLLLLYYCCLSISVVVIYLAFFLDAICHLSH